MSVPATTSADYSEIKHRVTARMIDERDFMKAQAAAIRALPPSNSSLVRRYRQQRLTLLGSRIAGLQKQLDLIGA